jgi:hypothetical protein
MGVVGVRGLGLPNSDFPRAEPTFECVVNLARELRFGEAEVDKDNVELAREGMGCVRRLLLLADSGVLGLEPGILGVVSPSCH